MRDIEEIKKNNRLMIERMGADGLTAFLVHPNYKLRSMFMIFSYGGGWEHLSVSLKKRCPTWDEMCMLKDVFWEDAECVVQFHPPKSEYVNIHPYCLHMWRKIGSEFELPPTIMV